MRGDAERVYAAEALCPPGRSFPSESELRAFVASVTGSPWWSAHGLPAVRVQIHGPGDFAFGGFDPTLGYFVRFPGPAHSPVSGRSTPVSTPAALRSTDSPRWAWNEHTALHELAHAAVRFDGGGGHGSAFATVYLELVGATCGRVARACLALAFDIEGVRFDRSSVLDARVLVH